MSIPLIMQRGEYDCAIAAIAMATGSKYETVAQAFAESTERKLTPSLWCIGRYLEKAGFAFHFRRGQQQPFAPTHIVKLMWGCPHYIAMDAEGRVYDPYPPYPGYDGDHHLIDHPDFTEVFWTLGLWKEQCL